MMLIWSPGIDKSQLFPVHDEISYQPKCVVQSLESDFIIVNW